MSESVPEQCKRSALLRLADVRGKSLESFMTTREERILTLVGEGDGIHARGSQPFSQCVIVARQKEKTARVLPKEADFKKTRKGEARQGRSSYLARRQGTQC